MASLRDRLFDGVPSNRRQIRRSLLRRTSIPNSAPTSRTETSGETKPVSDLERGLIQFSQACLPPLFPGQYRIRAEQHVREIRTDPFGSELEFADIATVTRALEGRIIL